MKVIHACYTHTSSLYSCAVWYCVCTHAHTLTKPKTDLNSKETLTLFVGFLVCSVSIKLGATFRSETHLGGQEPFLMLVV